MLLVPTLPPLSTDLYEALLPFTRGQKEREEVVSLDPQEVTGSWDKEVESWRELLGG